MFRAILVSMVMLGMVGCAAKASGPTVQGVSDELVLFKEKTENQIKSNDEKNTEQDKQILEINEKIDRVFKK